MPVREVRFDTTETGASKLCTIVELTLQGGQATLEHDDALLQAIGLVRDASGLNEVEVFDSIYNPGTLLSASGVLVLARNQG